MITRSGDQLALHRRRAALRVLDGALRVPGERRERREVAGEQVEAREHVQRPGPAVLAEAVVAVVGPAGRVEVLAPVPRGLQLVGRLPDGVVPRQLGVVEAGVLVGEEVDRDLWRRRRRRRR